MHNLDHLLPGVERLCHLTAHCPRAHPVQQALHNRKVHIRFQQRQPDFAQARVYICIREFSTPAEFFEYRLQLAGECFEHVWLCGALQRRIQKV